MTGLERAKLRWKYTIPWRLLWKMRSARTFWTFSEKSKFCAKNTELYTYVLSRLSALNLESVDSDVYRKNEHRRYRTERPILQRRTGDPMIFRTDRVPILISDVL